MEIRASNESDNADIRAIHIAAFGAEKGPVIADLAIDLLTDATAMPVLSLVAVENGQLMGHIIFTKVTITQHNEKVSAQILAPLAILPDAQKKVWAASSFKRDWSGLNNRVLRSSLFWDIPITTLGLASPQQGFMALRLPILFLKSMPLPGWYGN